MICFASFVPHAPLLIPGVAGDNIAKVSSTVKAYQKLEADLYSSKPDVILIISPHTLKTEENVFTINQSPEFMVSFKDFGDLMTNLKYKNDVGLAYAIKESSETKVPVILTYNEKINYGTGVPLYFLTKHLPNIKVISIGSSQLDRKITQTFGEIIMEQINNSGKRVAIIASGDLSHKLTQDSPKGFSPQGQEFDKQMMTVLSSHDFDAICRVDQALIDEAEECSFDSILLLMSIIKDINYKPEKLSYEAPFGIGYLVENFNVN